ncbi:MAG: flagellin [Anaerovoracaceae bacterium]
MISLIQTAEGALNETHSILQRMRELAVQASNDTNTADDRAEIQKEVDQLTQEIDRIANTTEFNTKKLLNGGASVNATVAGAAADQVTVQGGSAETQVGGTVTMTAFTTATQDTWTATATSLTENTAFTDTSAITINGVSFSFDTTDTIGDAIEKINDAGIGAVASLDGGKLLIKSNTLGSKSDLTIAGATNDFGGAKAEGVDATITAADVSSYKADGNKITVLGGSGNATGLEFEVSGATGAATLTVTSNGGLNMHIGANEGQAMYVSIGDMRAASLGVNAIDLTTTTNAESAITTINDAISKVSSERSKLGAFQNRLDHTINNLGASAENLTAAESRIRDVDMAKEMMEFTKNNILSQAAQSMLAQANQMPQGVLQLLQ